MRKDAFFILLSDTRKSVYPEVNRILAPEIAVNLLENLGELIEPCLELLAKRFASDMGFSKTDRSAKKDFSSFSVPFVTIRNITIVQKVGLKYH